MTKINWVIHLLAHEGHAGQSAGLKAWMQWIGNFHLPIALVVMTVISREIA